MKTLGMQVGLTFSKEALNSVYTETGGHPAFSRALGSQILKLGSGSVNKNRVAAAVNEFLKDQDQNAILRGIYESRLDKDEQEIVRKLTREGPQIHKSLFPPDADIEKRRQIKAAIANLVDSLRYE